MGLRIITSTSGEIVADSDKYFVQVTTDSTSSNWKALGDTADQSRFSGASYDTDTIGVQSLPHSTLYPTRFTKIRVFSGSVWILMKSKIGAE